MATKKPITMGKNLAGPSIELTSELSNLFDDFKTKFSSLLTMNLANTPLRKRKNVKIIKAIIISEIFIPETPLFQTSKNRFLKFSKTFI